MSTGGWELPKWSPCKTLTLVGVEFHLPDATTTPSSSGRRAAPQGEVDVEVLDHELGAGLVLLDLHVNMK